jgi:hypothetical protein
MLVRLMVVNFKLGRWRCLPLHGAWKIVIQGSTSIQCQRKENARWQDDDASLYVLITGAKRNKETSMSLSLSLYTIQWPCFVFRRSWLHISVHNVATASKALRDISQSYQLNHGYYIKIGNERFFPRYSGLISRYKSVIRCNYRA